MPRTKATATENKGQPTTIVVEALKREAMKVFLIGETPLVVHAWSHKARLELLKKHMQQITVREPKDPFEHFMRSIYRMEDGAYGFPVTGIKECVATAASDLEGVFKTQIYRNISVTGRRGYQVAAFADLQSPTELGELFSPNAPTMREDMVRLSGVARTPDLRYRAEFWPWAIRATIFFLPQFIASSSIVNLMQHGGFRVGLGEWRQEKGGNWGRFHVADQAETRAAERWAEAAQKEPEPIDIAKWLRSIQTTRQEPVQPAPEEAPEELVMLESPPRRRGRARKTNGEATHEG